MKNTLTNVKRATYVCAMFILLSLQGFGQVVISQVYGGGGNSGATWRNDFVELFNRGTAPVTMTSWSIQYTSAAGITWSSNNFTFSGTIPAGGYYLIQLGSGGAVGTLLPTADATGVINMSATAGKVALVSNATALTGSGCPFAGTVVDFVGFGATANCYEGTAPTGAPSATNAVIRASGGCTDANQNSTDFAVATPTPRNSATAANICPTAPSVTTNGPTSIGTSTVTFNGTFIANNASTTPSFDYGISPSLALNIIGTPSPITGTAPTSASATLSGLLVNTQYNYKARGTNSQGAGTGTTITFYTLANVPTTPTVATPTSSTLDVTIGTGDGNPSITQYAIQETGSGNYVQAGGSLAGTQVWQTALSWGTKTVTGLSSSSTYTFKVKARNGDNVETAFGSTASGTTTASGSPTISITASLSTFSTVAGTPSASQLYSVSGSNLTANIIITPPANFQVSDDNSTWVTNPSQLTVVQSGGTVTSAPVYVRFNPAAGGAYSASITHESTGASTQSIVVNGNALAAEPTVAPTVSFGTTSGNSMVINFPGGNGTSRIVVMNAATAVTFTPTDAVTSTGVNSIFTSATDQGSGNRIVFDGSATTVTVTGLSATTQYFVAVYEYNGSGVTTNYFSTAGTGNNTTLIAEPTVASVLTFGTIATNSMVLNFSGGNGTSRIVVAHEATAVSFVPADITVYTGANADFSLAADQGSGNKIVFDGSGTTVTVSGLTEGQTYFFRVYEYNGSGATANYLATPFGSGSTSTIGPWPYSVTGSSYLQNFNGLPASGTFTIPTTGFPFYLATSPVNASGLGGWQFGVVSGTPRFNVSDGSGSGPTGSTYSYGTGVSSDRALGAYASSSNISNIGIILKNTTSDILSNVTISYTGEQWRRGTGAANVFSFKYAVGGTDIGTGTFTSEPTLNFTSPISIGAEGALDGNATANRTAITSAFNLNANWLPGQTLVLRWDDLNDAGNDDGISIDEFSFVANPPVTPTVQGHDISFSSILTTTMTASWINGNGTGRIVKINTTGSFTNPVDGNTYPANPVYAGSGEQVIFDGSGSTVNISGLTAGTQYFVRVYEYNGSGGATKYLTTTAVLNPNSTTTAVATPPTQVVFLSVNNGANPTVNQPFDVVVQAKDGAGSPQNVTSPTTIVLTVWSGIGNLTGTNSGVIATGTSTLTITGVIYNSPDFGVQLDAAASAGDPLTNNQSALFDVLDVASKLGFSTTPANGIINTNVGTITVQARRPDNTVDPTYTGAITIAIATGPGAISAGTTTVNAVNGIATFTGIQFNTPGTYTLQATATGLTSATSNSIIITGVPVMTELVVPKYIGCKTTATTNNDRTPIAICIRIDNLLPNTLYDLRAGIDSTTGGNIYGGGNIWSGTAFTGNIALNAFTTNGTGSSGPVWFFMQPATSRFDPGMIHNIRVGYVTAGGTTPTTPNFIGTKTITALDIPTTERTVATTDDGAFLKGSAKTCIGGKFVLIYDNVAGTGDPLYSYQIRQATATNSTQSGLPTNINDVFLQSGTSAVGDYAAVIPIGANNPNGVRRIEARTSSNTIVSFAIDADGIWPGGANTTTIIRRGVAIINSTTDAPLNSVSITTSTTQETCAGILDGTATATATGNGLLSYSWNTSPIQTTSTATGLASGTYTVTVSDAGGCSATATAVVSQPAASTITPSGPTTFCVGGSVTLTAGSGVSYLWSTGATSQAIVVTTSGSYSVTVDNGAGCVQTSLPTVVTVNNFSFVGKAFAENIGVPTGTTAISVYTGWQNAAPTTISYLTNSSALADIRSTNVSSGYTGVSGGGNIFFGQTAGFPDRNFIISGINTLGYTGLILTFGLKRDITSTDPMIAEYSTNGTSWTALTFTNPTNTSWTLITASGTIPAAANLRLRFSKNSTVATFRLDDIVLSGTASSVNITSTGLILCPGASVVLTSNIPTSNVWAPGAQTTKSISVNTANSYTVTATGTNGCVTTSSPVVTQSVTAPAVTVTPTHVSCNAGNNGSAATFVTNGTSPYNYAWTTAPVQTTATATALVAGTYTVTVSDANGCTGTGSTTITQPTALVASAAVTTPIACNGGTASVTVSATNGTSPYLGTGTFSFTAGTYTYTVTDANNCSATTTITVTQPTALVASSVVTTPIACNGGTASVTISATNGTSPYVGTGTFSLAAGTYTYTITDANNCSATTTITVTQPTALVASSVVTTPIACNGGTASVTISATNGTSPYVGTGTFSLAAGTYTYTITDANNCSATTTITVTQPPQLVANASATAILCNGGSSTVTVSGSGGTGTLTGTGTSTQTAGTYTYTVTDANGCTATTSITITQPTALVATATSGTILCNGGTTTVTVAASGGTSGYSGIGSFTVTAGTYSYAVTDANSCTATTSITVTEPLANTISSFAPNSACPGTTVSIFGSNLSGITTLAFNGNSATFVVISSTELQATVPASATTGPINITNSSGCMTTSGSNFVVTTCSSGLTLNAKMYFEGYYQNPGSPTPMDNLGLGGCLFVNGMSANPNDADYVSISLMHASSYAVVESATGTLHIDGTVSVNFTTATAGTSYFIKVTHRNAVETWSSSPVLFSSITTYNFTTNATQAYGNNMIEVEPGIWAFYSGDIADANIGVGSQDGVIESTDYSEMENAVYSILSGYVYEDISGDGVVESTDYSIMENNVYSIISTIHP